jgi:hypothetical protein
MAAEHIKVRCYRCSQLLAVAASKAGAVVACPKCRAELLIPGPESELRASVSGTAVAKSRSTAGPEAPTFAEGLASLIPPDVAELRPEDLRVEAEFFESLTRPPVAPPGQEPFPLLLPSEPEPPPPAPVAIAGSLPANPEVLPKTVMVNPMPVDIPPPIPAPRPALEIPPIQVEPPTILPPGAEIRRVREVILPASVVLAWSLFVLAAIAMSFVAGILIGHFLWKLSP